MTESKRVTISDPEQSVCAKTPPGLENLV